MTIYCFVHRNVFGMQKKKQIKRKSQIVHIQNGANIKFQFIFGYHLEEMAYQFIQTQKHRRLEIHTFDPSVYSNHRYPNTDLTM
jgi:ABC-type uncharacterized transport system substrate-binding protein